MIRPNVCVTDEHTSYPLCVEMLLLAHTVSRLSITAPAAAPAPAAVFGNLTAMIHSLRYIMMRLNWGHITFDIWWTLSESLVCCPDVRPACAWWPLQWCQWSPVTTDQCDSHSGRCPLCSFLIAIISIFFVRLTQLNFRRVYKCFMKPL